MLHGSRQHTRSKTMEINIIPKPLELNLTGSQCMLPRHSRLFVHSDNRELAGIAQYLRTWLTAAYSGYEFHIADGNISIKEAGIHFLLNDEPDIEIGAEGYNLEIDQSVVITANRPQGIFYGVQTYFCLVLQPKRFYHMPGKNISPLPNTINFYQI